MLDETLEKIKKLDYQKRLELLNDKEIVKKVFLIDKKTNPWNFKKILEIYKASDLLDKMDSYVINKIKELYPYQEFVFLELLKVNDQKSFEKSLIENKNLMELLLINGENIGPNLMFSYDMVLKIIEYYDNNLKGTKTCLNYLIHTSLNSIYLQEKYLYSKVPDCYKTKLFHLLDSKLVTKYLKENIVNLNNDDLYNVLTLSRVELNPNLYENKTFFKDKIVKVTIYETRLELEKLNNLIDITYFEELLKKEELKHIEQFKNNKNFNLQTSLFNNLKVKDNRKLLLDTVIDYFFLDSSHNVYLNLVELVDFCLKNDNLINKSKLEFYKELLSIYKKDTNSIINFFFKYKNKYNYYEFYDDLRIAKDKSYQLIKDSLLKLDTKKLKTKDGIKIYELNGEPFNMLISCKWNIPEINTPSSRNCYTLINQNNMKVIYDNTYIFGYTNFLINNILHVYEDDAYSNDYINFNTTSYVNRIRDVDELINTNYRSEIQIINNMENSKYVSLMPSYVICFDELDKRSIEASKKLSIPIVIIHKDKYKLLNSTKNLPNYESEYTLTSYMESSALEKQMYRGK